MPVSRGFIFIGSVNPKSRHVPATDHKVLSRFGPVHLYVRRTSRFCTTIRYDFPTYSVPLYVFCLFWLFAKGHSLHVCLSTASVMVNLNVLVTSSHCWNFGSSGSYIKVLELSERDRVEQRRGRKNRSIAIRYQNGGACLSGVMSLVHTDTILDELLVLVGGTTTPKRGLKRNKIGGTEIAVLITFAHCDPRISGAFFSCLLSCP